MYNTNQTGKKFSLYQGGKKGNYVGISKQEKQNMIFKLLYLRFEYNKHAYITDSGFLSWPV